MFRRTEKTCCPYPKSKPGLFIRGLFITLFTIRWRSSYTQHNGTYSNFPFQSLWVVRENQKPVIEANPSNMRLGELRNFSGRYVEEKNRLPLPGIEGRSLCRPVLGFDCMQTDLSRFNNEPIYDRPYRPETLEVEPANERIIYRNERHIFCK
jgi:hypothetical protein